MYVNIDLSSDDINLIDSVFTYMLDNGTTPAFNRKYADMECLLRKLRTVEQSARVRESSIDQQHWNRHYNRD